MEGGFMVNFDGEHTLSFQPRPQCYCCLSLTISPLAGSADTEELLICQFQGESIADEEKTQSRTFVLKG
jgi:hypothetical protein